MDNKSLNRVVGIWGAVFLGLGSIVGTGVFVSLGLGAGVAGPSVIVALFIAAGLASFNGLSSAQLAASHPVSGGTYEYGYQYLSPGLGFLAGWMFLLAKSASAATAALGFAGYLSLLLGLPNRGGTQVGIAVAGVVGITLVILAGMKRTNVINAFIVSLTLVTLGAFVFFGIDDVLSNPGNFAPFFMDGKPLSNLLEASALMFVAFTGYGRIATLGEEVKDPRKTIPKAVISALLVSWLLYSLVALIAVGSVGADQFFTFTTGRAAPLEAIAKVRGEDGIALFVAIGAITAMMGVLLNLILGLSRVALAMGRRQDIPQVFGKIAGNHNNPTAAILLCSGIIILLTLVGNVKTTWSFSAFTVLIYYAITNLTALKLPTEKRLYPLWTAVAGLLGCVGLAFWIEPGIWVAGGTAILVGFVLRWLFQIGRSFTR